MGINETSINIIVNSIENVFYFQDKMRLKTNLEHLDEETELDISQAYD